jgi:hypothetical protein
MQNGRDAQESRISTFPTAKTDQDDGTARISFFILKAFYAGTCHIRP